MSTIAQSTATADYQARREAAERRSAAARKAAETRRNNKREQREFEQSQENKLAWTYENTLTIEQRQELELSLMQAEADNNRKAKQFAYDQRQMIASVLKTAAIKYGWNQVKAATTLRSYDAPLDVCYEEQHIRLAEVLDSFLFDDEHPEFKDLDDYFGDEVPELSSEERTETFPEEDESACKGCGKAIGEDDDWVPVPGHSATGVLCPSCADATVGAEGETVTNN
jgi:hypothetical protein